MRDWINSIIGTPQDQFSAKGINYSLMDWFSQQRALNHEYSLRVRESSIIVPHYIGDFTKKSWHGKKKSKVSATKKKDHFCFPHGTMRSVNTGENFRIFNCRCQTLLHFMEICIWRQIDSIKTEEREVAHTGLCKVRKASLKLYGINTTWDHRKTSNW